VQITDVERIIPISGDPNPAILDRLPHLTLGSLSDTAAKAMLDASAISSTTFLRWHLENLIGATTLTDHEIDILVAHWAGTGNDSASAEVWMWDDAIGVVTGAVVKAGKAKQFEALLREEIVKAMQNPTEALGNILRNLEPALDVDVSDLALKCIGLHWYASDQARRYLKSRDH